MIYETYICAKANDHTEYGFTFKSDTETGDWLFDLVLGEVPSNSEAGELLNDQWQKFEWAAKAIVGAAR